MYELLAIYREDSKNTKEEIVILQKEYEKILNYYDALNIKIKMMH